MQLLLQPWLQRVIFQSQKQREMNEIITGDTIYTTNDTLDKVCVIGIGCKIHTHVHNSYKLVQKKPLVAVEPSTTYIFLDEGIFKIYVNEFGDTMISESLVSLPKEELVRPMEQQIQFNHEIKPCNESLVQKHDYTPYVIPSRIKRQDTGIATNNGAIDGYVIDSLVLTFMTLVFIKYVIDEFYTWVDFGKELKNAINS